MTPLAKRQLRHDGCRPASTGAAGRMTPQAAPRHAQNDPGAAQAFVRSKVPGAFAAGPIPYNCIVPPIIDSPGRVCGLTNRYRGSDRARLRATFQWTERSTFRDLDSRGERWPTGTVVFRADRS